MDQPALVVVGTGIRTVGQLTTEAVAWMRLADKLLYLVNDPVGRDIVGELNKSAESLAGHYAEGKDRRQSLEAMANRVLECVGRGGTTCLALFGHPGVFSWLGHEAVRRARAEGFTARMLPGISADACLFADLGLDPAASGCQSYEAMDFLQNHRQPDPTALLLLWQIGVMGDPVFRTKGYDLKPLPRLVARLGELYGPDHEVILYVAPLPFAALPLVKRLPLRRLARAKLTAAMTLCVPPKDPGR